MEDNNKSVFERLDKLEEIIVNDNSNKQVSVSELIGEPFDKYMETSQVYYYEPDERAFRNYKKKYIKRYSIFISIFSILLILHTLISIFTKTFLIGLFIADLLLISLPVFYLINIIKLPNKRIANSKWNFINHRFYICDNQLKVEKNKGTINYIILAYQILTSLYYILSIIPYLQISSLLICHLLSLVILSLYFVMKGNYEWIYSKYIFDNKTSYVITDKFFHKWEKIEK